MMIFDASNRDECQVRRTRTNTPLQALMMMNDPTVLEASLAMADQLLKNNAAPETVVSTAFKRIICRTPAKKETDVLLSYWNEEKTYFKSNSANAAKLIKVGQYKPSIKDASELAALMQTIEIIYNMEEAITKNREAPVP
jgi:hypothetical protein